MTLIHMIDDNPLDSFVLRLNIKQLELDWQVLSYTDGSQALAELKKNRASEPEIILVDIHMPGLGGFDFVQAFSSLPGAAKRNRTLCIATGSQNEEHRARAAALPIVAAFYPKPLDPTLIEQLFEQAKAG